MEGEEDHGAQRLWCSGWHPGFLVLVEIVQPGARPYAKPHGAHQIVGLVQLPGLRFLTQRLEDGQLAICTHRRSGFGPCLAVSFDKPGDDLIQPLHTKRGRKRRKALTRAPNRAWSLLGPHPGREPSFRLLSFRLLKGDTRSCVEQCPLPTENLRLCPTRDFRGHTSADPSAKTDHATPALVRPLEPPGAVSAALLRDPEPWMCHPTGLQAAL